MRRRNFALRRFATVLVTITAVACTTGRSAMGARSKPTFRYTVARAQRPPPCAHAGRVIALPRAFPGAFPVPAGTWITASIGFAGGITSVVGFIPASNVYGAGRFFEVQLPRAGFFLTQQDAEPNKEVESAYVGHGFSGRWRVQRVPGCAGTVRFDASSYPLKGHGR